MKSLGALVESANQSTTTSPVTELKKPARRQLTEDMTPTKLERPPRIEEARDNTLNECYDLKSPFDYNADPKDRLRGAVGQIVQALLDMTYKNIGDDGRIMKKTDYKDKNFWDDANALIRKEVYVDKYLALIPNLKEILDSYME